MLLDHQRHVVDVDLLDHPGHDRGHGFQVMPAPGAKIKAMVERIAVDQFRREGGAFVLWVTGLPADAAPLLALRRCRFGRLDDVGGRRLGRGRGILPRRGELLLETSNGALEHLQTRLLGVQLRLQAPTVRARLPCLGSHDGLCYTHRREYTTPVNGHESAMPDEQLENWHQSVAHAVRAIDDLMQLLKLPARGPEHSVPSFPLLVPRSYVARMRPGDPNDPLLLQVLPSPLELIPQAEFVPDPLLESKFRPVPGLLHKFHSRALLIVTGVCAVHCRYCFRRSYPYRDEPHRQDEWTPAIDYLRAHSEISEVILSGGDPLMWPDSRLEWLCGELSSIGHVGRVRMHSRLPIVLPNRVTEPLLKLLRRRGQRFILVVHSNHPNEVVGDCSAALEELTRAGVMVLNQSVLMRGINDSADTLCELSLRLIEVGVMPYYLLQLDRSEGAAHFEVPIETGRSLMTQLRKRLPGYAVPRYVQEFPGHPFKLPLC